MRRGVEGSHHLSNENSGALPRYFFIIILRKPMDKDKIQHKELELLRFYKSVKMYYRFHCVA